MTRTGDPTTLEITESSRETFDGDLLFPGDVEVPLDFVPHSPAPGGRRQIISIVDGTRSWAEFQVVVINRGSSHGLEPGHVLQIEQAGSRWCATRTKDGARRVSATFARESVRLPDELDRDFHGVQDVRSHQLRPDHGIAGTDARGCDRVISP